MSTDSFTSRSVAGPRPERDPHGPDGESRRAAAAAGVRGPAHGRARGFSLVELALAIVIISLLIGGILKGWQLIESSRVRTLADTTTSVQAAYFAFHDRYGHVAGDWNAVDAGNAIGTTVNGGGNDSGRLDTTPTDPWTESNAFWEQLAKAGFINGHYEGTAATEPNIDNGLAPLNVYGRPIMIGRTLDFEGAVTPRRHVVVGRQAPVGALRELDVKLDDGKPAEGKIRATVDDGAVSVFTGANLWGGRESGCVNVGMAWDAGGDARDCNALLIF